MIRSIAELRERLAELRAAAPASGASAPTVALISTMGALHAGHLDLIREAKANADIVVVSLFVNPLRFATADETAAYPRTPDTDEAHVRALGVDIVFAPTAAELLPEGTRTMRVSAGDLGLRYEGRTRPFYFDGLLTVEAKLYNIVQPDIVVHGLRDRQRVFLIQRMIRDLDFGVRLLTVETVRGEDLLPISSRVELLEPRDRAAAAKLPAALAAAASNADRGVDACIAAAQSSLMGEERIRLEYLSVVDPKTFLPVDEDHRGPAFALIAATVAGHRFVDNEGIYIG